MSDKEENCEGLLQIAYFANLQDENIFDLYNYICGRRQFMKISSNRIVCALVEGWTVVREDLGNGHLGKVSRFKFSN